MDWKNKEFLGHAGFGAVFKCDYHGHSKPIAVKIIKQISDIEESQKEASILSSLSHPNIVRMLGICEIDQIGYEIGIMMEFANLGSLQRHYKNLSELQTAQVCLDMCNGLQYLHSKDIIHHDLKLENVLLDGDLNHELIAKIADFGLPRAMEFLGSIQYMAPELAQNHPEYNYKIDIYSLTIIIFELYTKQRFPFQCNSIFPMAKIKAVQESIKPELPNDLPTKLLDFIPKGWHIDPEIRPDLQDFIKIFEEMIELQSTQSDLQEEVTSLTIRKHIDNLGKRLLIDREVKM